MPAVSPFLLSLRSILIAVFSVARGAQKPTVRRGLQSLRALPFVKLLSTVMPFLAKYLRTTLRNCLVLATCMVFPLCCYVFIIAAMGVLVNNYFSNNVYDSHLGRLARCHTAAHEAAALAQE